MNTIGEVVLNLVNLILGAVVGYYYNYWEEKRRKRAEQRNIEAENQRLYQTLKDADTSIQTECGIVQIEHGTPYFERTALTTSVKDDRVCYYPIPMKNDLKEKLADYGFTQTNKYKLEYNDGYNCLSPQFLFKADFNDAFSCFGNYSWDEKTKAEIAEMAEVVANDFLEDLKKGKKRFNGSMLGVKKVKLNNDEHHDERPTASIEYYISDYFTYRVFAKFYLKHKDEFQQLHSTPDVKVLQKLSMPFLSSFGVAAVIIGTTGDIRYNAKLCDTDTIISGMRGGKVIVDCNLIHFGMNEAFSYSMDSEHNNTPSYTHCVLRGITEELLGYKVDSEKGKQYEQYIGTPYFLDLIFDSNKCEMGIIAYVKLKFSLNESEGFTRESFLNLYNEAKDRTLETEKLLFTPLSNLDTLINEYENSQMSASYFTALTNLKRRIAIGLI